MVSTMAEIRTHTFPNGLTLAVEEQPWNPGVSFTILVPAGAVTDPEGLEGASSVLESWLWKGAGTRDARSFAQALDALGVRRASGAGLEYTTFSASLLAPHLGEALALYADLLQRPWLPEEEFEAVRLLALQELAALEDQPSKKLFVHLRRAVFTSPHGRDAAGRRKDLLAMTPDALRADYARRYGARGVVIGVCGGVRFEEVRELVEAHWGEWTGGAPELPAVALSEPHTLHVPQDTAQVQIGLFYTDVPPTHPEFYTARLAAEVLSGGMASRLFTEVREKRGLVYAVSASPGSVGGMGYLAAYAGTTPERAAETLRVLTREIARLSEGVSADELARAKVGVRSALVMQGESSRARAAALARDWFVLGRVRSLEEIEREVEAVTLERINRFLEAHPYERPWVGTLGAQPVEVA